MELSEYKKKFLEIGKKHGAEKGAYFNFSESPSSWYYEGRESVEVNLSWQRFLRRVGAKAGVFSVNVVGTKLFAGCQRITDKQQEEIFKLLAERLGYELED